MKRITIIPAVSPTDLSPVPVPKLTFGTQKANKMFPTGGLVSLGSIRFNINNGQMVALAKEAFINNSFHKDSDNALNLFLLSLAVTSAFEGGFDAVNAYDTAGISLGFLQFARPEGGVGRLLELIGRQDLAEEVKTRFGTKDPHASPSAMKARFDTELMKKLVLAAASPEGIRAQLAMAVNKNVDGQKYFDKAYGRFVELKLSDPLSCSLLFDAAINMGVGSLSGFPPCTDGIDGKWIQTSIPLMKRPERRKGWQSLLTKNFA